MNETKTAANIILRQHNGVDIPIRVSDRYVNVTKLCEANGKRWNNYRHLQSTKDYLAALASDAGIPVSELVKTKKGGIPSEQGAYAHPEVAIDCAAWISPVFRVHVNRWINELLSTGTVSIGKAETPDPVRYWSLRMGKSYWEHQLLVNQLGPGKWSILTAMIAMILATEDELLHHALPIKITDRPDGSAGLRFKHFRDGLGLADPCETAKLVSTLPNGKTIDIYPRVYPASEREMFEKWMFNDYLPKYLPDYLERKYKKQFGPLPPLSAADHTVRRLLGHPASLKPEYRRQLDAVGGFVPAQAIGRVVRADQPGLPGLGMS